MLIGRCITPKCNNPCAVALKRGMCTECHGRAEAMVFSGQATWGELAEIGVCLLIDDQIMTKKEFMDTLRSNGYQVAALEVTVGQRNGTRVILLTPDGSEVDIRSKSFETILKELNVPKPSTVG